MKKIFLLILFLLILSCGKNSGAIETLKKVKFDKPIILADYIARIVFYTEGNFVSVNLDDLSVESLKSLYTYNYYEDFSYEYKKLNRPSYIVGWFIIDEFKNKKKEQPKTETSKNESISSDENIEIDLDEIYNTKDTSKLSKLNEIELKILQNYPFAKDGYVFETPELKEYFESQSWYEPSTTLSNNEISIKNKDDEWFIYMKNYNNF